jgi:hypothetical protein
MHTEAAQQLRKSGHEAEVVLQNAAGRVLGRIDGLVIDAQNKVLIIIELKPETQRALQRGAAQVAQYADDMAELIRNNVGKWAQYSDYTIRTEIRSYPPPP